ncbi:MAG: TonB-dependent receptor [Leeuwenhoekiella sp.]
MARLFPLFFLFTIFGFSQNATVLGIVFDENNTPLGGVNISAGSTGTETDGSGFYSINISANEEVTLTFSYLGFKNVEVNFSLLPNQVREFNPVLKTSVEQISSVVLRADSREKIFGITTLSPETVRKIPGANPGVENLLATLPGVSSNNELSTQYAVRGGNYDENLVYVNGIEVYRPFLIRSGQQEGLSFVNTDLVRDIDFSAGGFQAKYGDKLSSVLDITYRRPVDFGAGIEASLLGGSVYAEGTSKDKKLTGIVGARYRDNSLLVNAKQTETNFKPRFTDIQTYVTYNFSKKFELGFLGSLAVNKYDFEPQTRQTNFGTLADPIALIINYNGQEQDKYDTYFGALKGNYKVNDHFLLTGIFSAYQTQEQEFFDILANYALGTPNTSIGDEDIGEVEFTRGIGSQLTHARNQLHAVFINAQIKGQYQKNDGQLDVGLKFTREDIRDRLQEYEIIDSAGFSVRPPNLNLGNDQPYTPYDAPLVPFTSVRANNDVQIDRISAFAQWSQKKQLDAAKLWYNIGLRAQQWTVTNDGNKADAQLAVSPRAQVSLKPDWKTDMIFRLATGIYQQPPLYRELRDSLGQVRPEVKAQKSYHVVAGNDWSFKLWERPFTLTSEAYYKKLWDVNPYTLENVRIRYRARNNAEAFAYGLDLRLNGEFVLGTESWVSLGYLNTQENIDDRGFIPRPTDQRLKIGALFQDYVPTMPNLKLYINMVYQTGLPGGSPSYADPYRFQVRLPFYFRSDVGFSYVLIDNLDNSISSGWKKAFEELSFGLEIFNIFDRQNSITNTFVRDAASQRQFAVPNFLSPRVFNVRLGMRF